MQKLAVWTFRELMQGTQCDSVRGVVYTCVCLCVCC
jgi:hypothetical protein